MADQTYDKGRGGLTGLGGRFLAGFSLLLLGYIVFGRSLAAIGVGSIYIGEIFLVWGVVACLLTQHWSAIFREAPVKWLAAFMCLGFINTLPYIQTYGFDSLRDAVIWSYGLFAVVVAITVSASPDRLIGTLKKYHAFTDFFPYIMFPIVMLLTFFGFLNPGVPWGLRETPLVALRSGEIMVHAMAVLAFGLVGLRHDRGRLWYALLVLIAMFMAFGSRASILVALAAFSLLFCIGVKFGKLGKFFAYGFLVLFLFLAFDVDLGALRGGPRNISLDQIWLNLQSIFVFDVATRLDVTKYWRLVWWENILNRVLFGPYFLTGMGFGINLSQLSGLPYFIDPTTRSPHSIHFTILGRMGVPGLLVWGLMLMSWASMIWRHRKIAQSEGYETWAAVFAVLLVYFAVMLVNASFDIYIEGPMGGIWFWTVFGFGVAACRVFRAYPDLLGPLRRPS